MSFSSLGEYSFLMPSCFHPFPQSWPHPHRLRPLGSTLPAAPMLCPDDPNLAGWGVGEDANTTFLC